MSDQAATQINIVLEYQIKRIKDLEKEIEGAKDMAERNKRANDDTRAYLKESYAREEKLTKELRQVKAAMKMIIEGIKLQDEATSAIAS